MAVIKGKLAGIETSQDGSQVKIRLSSGDSVVLSVDSMLELVEELMRAKIVAEFNRLDSPAGLPNRYQPIPPVVVARTINGLKHHATDQVGLDVEHGKDGRFVLLLSQELRAFLAHHLADFGRDEQQVH